MQLVLMWRKLIRTHFNPQPFLKFDLKIDHLILKFYRFISVRQTRTIFPGTN